MTINRIRAADHLRAAWLMFAAALLTFLMPLASALAASCIIRVPADFPTIQAAIDAAGPGCEIIVAPGTYNEAIDLLGKAIHVRGSGGPTATTIDATGLNRSVVTCASGEGPDTILEGFTITGGNAERGGGMYNSFSSSPTVINCTIARNTALNGGGMSNLVNCSPTLIDCRFESNRSEESGGAIANFYFSSPRCTRCTFEGNVAGWDGGAMHNDEFSSPILSDCAFLDNVSEDGDGGGMFNENESSPTLTDCTFIRNFAAAGGGMSNDDESHATLMNCLFEDNSAIYVGGGVFNDSDSSPTLTGCRFTGNTADLAGGGMFNWIFSSPEMSRCDFVGNMAAFGGGVANWTFSSPTLTDCFFEGNTAQDAGGAVENDMECIVTLVRCRFTGNVSGGYGGAIANWRQSHASMSGCSFQSNSAGYGGAVSSVLGSAEFDLSEFEANHADYDGGGVFNHTSIVVLSGCTFTSNSAEESGGGVWGSSGSTSEIATTFFCGNSPEHVVGPWNDLGGNEFHATCTPIALAVAATCPSGGPIRIEWSGASPGGQIALIFARNTGSFIIPNNRPCAGTQLGLGSNQIQLAFQGGAGANGSRTLNTTAGPGACGGYLQLLDLTTCGTSNVARVE